MQHGTLIPRAPKLSPAAIVMAVVVHCLLVAGLWFGVSWQPKPEQVVSAEVWDVQVREAAPLAAGPFRPLMMTRAFESAVVASTLSTNSRS